MGADRPRCFLQGGFDFFDFLLFCNASDEPVDKSICRQLFFKDRVTVFHEALFELIPAVVISDEFNEIINLKPLTLEKVLSKLLEGFCPVVIQLVQWFLEVNEPQSMT